MSPNPSIDEKEQQLLAAGWKRIHPDLWEDPNGKRWLGPHGAWRRMREIADRQALPYDAFGDYSQ